ncbi:MAG TPA: DUF4405 domain-containing protein [Bacteroidetes bacterium]|nr:DUF4405 domain-containing protein [Bacteroidota bacterium]
MKKTSLLLLVDVLMFIFLALMSGLGLMIKYVLVPGSKRWDIYGRNVDLTFLGMDRHGWGTVHLICAVIFISLLILHIILHWKCLVNYLCRIVDTKAQANFLIIMFAAVLFFLISFPFMIKIKVTELGEGRDRFLHEQVLEHHDIDPDIEVLGSMSLINVSVKYDVPVSHILDKLDLPSTVSGNEQLGRLRRLYGFKMSDIEMIIHNYRHR